MKLIKYFFSKKQLKMSCSMNYFTDNLEYFLYSFAFIGLIDLVLYLTRFNKSRWFKLHLIVNLIVVIYTFNDFKNVLINPMKRYSGYKSSLIPPNITFALHLYHVLLFRNLQVVDWIHHCVMMSVLMFAFYCPHSSITNTILFVTNGLPGGIDYFLLILVKDKKIQQLTEKKINSKLNVWLRGPAILFTSYIVYLQWRYSLTDSSLIITLTIMTALYWNAQYFTERVVYNWGNYTSTYIFRNF